jgi:hypothetical protein
MVQIKNVTLISHAGREDELVVVEPLVEGLAVFDEALQHKANISFYVMHYADLMEKIRFKKREK